MHVCETESGAISEIQLHTLAKNSASKLPELRQDFAWFTKEAVRNEESKEEGTTGLGFFMHGGSILNVKTKKKKFLNDFYHLDVESGLFRKFFLFDAAKGRACHSMACIQNEVFLYGGEGLKETVFDDLWRFDLENVQWLE